MQRHSRSPRTRLVASARSGPVTLVLGAGVSLEAGVPNWRELATQIWQQALKAPGNSSTVDTLNIEKIVQDPQLLPIIFELAEERLGTKVFVETLRSCIYERALRQRARDSGTTLGAIAEAISRDHLLGPTRRIVRVVTFNADELLREALRPLSGPRGQFWQTMDHRVTGIPSGRGRQRVPIYHVHGFLPRSSSLAGHYSEHRLVFTDSQYWESSTAQASLANRTMNSALADSHCVFVGLSMTDANLLRWLALRHNEIRNDARYRANRPRVAILEGKAANANLEAEEREPVADSVRRKIVGHYWIRTPDDDSTGVLSAFLRLRGVEAVQISGWGDGSFARLFAQCFPAETCLKI
jgi:hypothetical protein